MLNSHSKRTTGMTAVIIMLPGTSLSTVGISVGMDDTTVVTTAGVLGATGTTQAGIVDPAGQGIQALAPNCGW